MIESLRSWVINICSTIFFITAVDMILPDNSMKKYTRFVLGMILIVVLINPILNIFNKNININSYINTASEYFEQKNYEKDYKKYKDNSISNTAGVFAHNLEKICMQKLKDNFPKDNYKVEISANYDEKAEKFIIDKLNVGVYENKILRIKKVDVKNSKEVAIKDEINSEKKQAIVNYLSEIVNVPKNKISVYKI